jgi:hypothetical protein
MDHSESRFEGQLLFAVRPEEEEIELVRGLSRALIRLAKSRPELDLRERVTLLLMKELSQEQDAFPSLRYLSERLGCSPGVARSSIRAVERAGLVQRTERFVSCSTGGGTTDLQPLSVGGVLPACQPGAALEPPARRARGRGRSAPARAFQGP